MAQKQAELDANAGNIAEGGGDGRMPISASGVTAAAKKVIGKYQGVSNMCAMSVRAYLKAAGHPKWDTIATKTGNLDPDGTAYIGPTFAASFAGTDLGQHIMDKSKLKPGDILLYRDTISGFTPGAVTHVGVMGENGMQYDHNSRKGFHARTLSSVLTWAKWGGGIRLKGMPSQDSPADMVATKVDPSSDLNNRKTELISRSESESTTQLQNESGADPKVILQPIIKPAVVTASSGGGGATLVPGSVSTSVSLMAEAKSKIRFYKYVTPPKDGGATISVGNKTIAGSNFTATINAVNSLGATVNSIAVALQGQRAAQQNAQAQADRRAQLQRDRQREGRLESTKGKAKEIVGGVVKGGASFLESLFKFLKDFLIFTALDWLSDPANRERIQKVVDGIGNFFNWMRDTFNWVTEWISENWEKTFGEDKTWRERLEGASGLLLGAGAALLGLAFLRDPIGTIANFTKIITTVGKGILNIGKALGGTALGQVAMGATQGYFAYQDVMENYDGPEEDRVAAARGAATGATVGAVGLGMLGNKIAGPLGGIIGNALGGFLGKEAGKFLGPIVGDFFNTLQDVFGGIMSLPGRDVQTSW